MTKASELVRFVKTGSLRKLSEAGHFIIEIPDNDEVLLNQLKSNLSDLGFRDNYDYEILGDTKNRHVIDYGHIQDDPRFDKLITKLGIKLF